MSKHGRADIAALRVDPGRPARIHERDPDETLGLDKDEGKELLDTLHERLAVLHQRLYAESRRSILLVLQGLDASGKDGVIRSVFSGLNPQGCRVVSFKAPTSTELAHDYFWRVHAVLPARGELGIFNRSHYEDIVTVRMRELAPEEVWNRRPGHVRRVGAHADGRGDDGREGLPQCLEGRATGATTGANRQSGEAVEVPARRPRGSETVRRLHRRDTRTHSPRRRRSGRRGTSFRPIATGSRPSL